MATHCMYVHHLFALFPEAGVGVYGTRIVYNYEHVVKLADKMIT